MRFLGAVIGLTCFFMSGCLTQHGFPYTPEKQNTRWGFPLARLWVKYVGTAETGFFAPATDGRYIYVASARGDIFSLTKTGHTKWHVSWQKGIAAGVQADNEIVSFIDAIGTLVVLNASTGQVIWCSHVTEPLMTLPVVDGPDIAVRSLSAVYLFDKKSGQRKWRTSELIALPARALRVRASSPLFFTDHTVYSGTQSGEIFALDRHNGHVVWATHENMVVADIEKRSAATVGPLSVTEHYVCSASFMGTYRCFDRGDSARLVWSVQNMSSKGGVLSDHKMYLVDHSGRLMRFAVPSGQVMWQHQLDDTDVPTRPIFLHTMLMLGNEHSMLFFIHTENGAMLYAQNLHLGPLDAMLLAKKDNLIVVLSRFGWLAGYRFSQ